MSEFKSSNLEDTHRHARGFAKKVGRGPLLILLEGPLGVGKTEWVRGFAHAFLGKGAVVSSPTYSIINEYKKGRKKLFHIDLYRLRSADDLESIGFWDLLEHDSIVIVEWGDKLERKWPKSLNVSQIKLSFDGESCRHILDIHLD